MEELLNKEHSSRKVYPPSIDISSYMDYPTPHFYKENFNPPSMIFEKSQSLNINKGEGSFTLCKAQTKNL